MKKNVSFFKDLYSVSINKDPIAKDDYASRSWFKLIFMLVIQMTAGILIAIVSISMIRLYPDYHAVVGSLLPIFVTFLFFFFFLPLYIQQMRRKYWWSKRKNINRRYTTLLL